MLNIEEMIGIKDRLFIRIADPAIFSNKDGDFSVASMMCEAGVDFDEHASKNKNNERVKGWEACRQMFMGAHGTRERKGAYITYNCEHLVRTLTALDTRCLCWCRLGHTHTIHKSKLSRLL